MGLVTINGRELKVWDRTAPGSLGKSREVAFAERKVKEAQARGELLFDAIAELILAYVRDNEGVSVEWLFANLPQDCSGVIRACVEATGMKLAGEAPSP